MPVQVATLDILRERASFNPETARAVGDAIDMELNYSRNDLVTKLEFEEFRREVLTQFTLVRNEFRSELKSGLSDLRADMVRWMFTAMVGQTTLILGIVYFMLQHVR